MMKHMALWLGLGLGLCGVVGPARALELSGTITGSRVVKAGDSPLRLSSTVTIPKGSSLTIEAGVLVEMGPKACLVVQGEVHALGEKKAPVRFQPATEGQRWGNIKILGDKDLPCYDGSRVFIPASGGSRLIGCEISGGGAVADDQYDGGALYLNGSAPIVRDCLFTDNQADRGGALVIYNFATPLVEGCTFESNASLLDDGGAVHCFFYSDAIISRNFFVLNQSARHGGGLYISVSNPLVQENAFIDNSAQNWGGAIYLSSSSPKILDNAIYESSAEDRSTGIALQADCQPEIRGNSLLSGGVEVFGFNLGRDVDLSGNWWGVTEEFQIQGKVQQRGRGQDRGFTLDPWRDRPVANLLTQPVEILSLHVMADRDWADTLAFDLCDQALSRVQIRAVDRNKYAVDQTGAELRILERPDFQATLIFTETGKATGIFRARLAINRDEEDMPRLDVRVGEHVLLRSTANAEIRQVYRVDEARPVVHSLALLSDTDPTHALADAPRLGWSYFSLLGDAQEAWQLQVATDSTFTKTDMWDSGAKAMSQASTVLTYEGPALKDGQRYFLRLRGQGGGAWSEWRRFMVRTDGPLNTLRQNSIPPLPELLEPTHDQILAVVRPVLKARSVVDLEGDAVGYEFQVAEDEFFQRVVATSGPAWREASWTLPLDLADNGNWWWRLRVHDGFEASAWSVARRFHVNSVEQAPIPFDLVSPAGGIADLQPDFTWQGAPDPDPLSSVTYTLIIATREDLQGARRVENLAGTSHRLKDELVNRQPLWWTVDATDNSGRVTRARRVARLEPDTTPSTPLPLFPTQDEEWLAGQLLRFTPAVDPWTQDRLSYEVQVFAASDATRALFTLAGLGKDELAAMGMDAMPESRLIAEDKAHSWRLRAVDNHGAASAWSPPAAFWMNRINAQPTLPQLQSPADGALLRDTPQLAWQTSTDGDHSDPPASLAYTVQLCRDADFKGDVVEEKVTGAGNLVVGARVTDNQRWYWRVQCMDNGGAASGWTAPRAFILNRQDEDPRGLAWESPAEAARQSALDRVELAWMAATDPDWNARLDYGWRISPAREPGRILAQGRTAETRTTARAVLSSREDYLLHLSVKDETGREQALAPRRITVDSHPVAPLLKATEEELGLGGVLSWEAATDPDPADRLSYRVVVMDAKGATLASQTLSTLQTVVGKLTGAALLPEDQELRWKVVAVDPHTLEAESAQGSFWFNKANDAPAAPSFAADVPAGKLVRDAKPRLGFTPGKDRDHSDPPATVRHELQVASTAAFTGAQSVMLAAGAVVVADVGLGDNATWHLRLRAVDRQGAASAWSKSIQLTVNTQDEAPSAPQLREPAMGRTLVDLTGVDVAWTASTDADPDARIHYVLTLGDAKGKLLDTQESTQTRLRLARKLPNGEELRLQVKAVDETGLESASTPLAFTVDSRPGSCAINGREGLLLGAADAIAWTAATDPNPADKLVYELQWAPNRTFQGGGAQSGSALRMPVGQLASLPENGDVWMRVRAKDPNGLEGPWSNAWPAVVDMRNDAPQWKGALQPVSGTYVAGDQSLAWEAPVDPDRRPQTLQVEIQASVDGRFATPLWSKKVDAAATLPLALKPGTLHLRARALDQAGATSAWSPVVVWKVDAPAPPTP